jgi:hypothetical protein
MQQLQPVCLCGIQMDKRDRCPVCGVKWEYDAAGVWAIGFRAVAFTPSKRKLTHYERYMKWRDTQSSTGRNIAQLQRRGGRKHEPSTKANPIPRTPRIP